jgi:hypothetical protein
MKQNIGKWFGRSKNLVQRTRAKRLRQLRLEPLEGRRLLAADLGGSVGNHNYLIAEDVNQDFTVSPVDALLVINALNNGGSRSFGEGEVASGVAAKLDVNGDNLLSPIDALGVINRLNGEGEDGQFLISYSYQVTDTSGTPITSAVVGETFRITVFVQDTRDIPPNPDPTKFGVYSAANDLGVSNLDLVTYQTTTNFFSGVTFIGDFFNDQGANEGGGIQINGTQQPSVSDGQTFSIDTGSGPVTFEFDWDGLSTFGNTVVSLRNPADTDPPTPLTFNEVASAMITAIEGASLGLTPTNNGQGVVGLPVDQITFDAGTSALTLSTVDQEYLNEVKAFLDRSRSPDPTGQLPFYSVEFTADEAGTVTFNPNGPDRPGSENLLFGSSVVIPNDMIMFGSSFSIDIISDPSAPVAVNDTLSTAEDTSLALNGNVTGNDTVEAGRTLAIDSVSTIPGVTLGTLSGTTYTPPANFFGTDRVTYVVRDSSGLVSNTATVTISVSAVNDAPEAFDDSFTAAEDSTNNVLAVLADNGNGADNAGPNEPSDTITITAVGAGNQGGSISIQPGGAALLYTPATGFRDGTETFTYTITDSGGLTDTATVSVRVEPAVVPFARPDAGSGAENTSVTIDVLANDSETPGSTKVLVSFGQGSFGTVTQSGDQLVYTPSDENFYGQDTFTYTMNDSSEQGVDSTATVTVTITDVNDSPVLVNDVESATEDTAKTIAISTLLSNDSPGAGENVGVAQQPQTLTLTSVSALTTGGGSVAIVGSNVVYTPAEDFNDANGGPFEFTYTAVDNGNPALSGTATVTVNVAAVNDNPIANNDTVGATEDTTLDIADSSLLSNDAPGPQSATDEAGQTLSVTGVSASSANGGSVTRSGTTISYSPAPNFNGTDTFTYTISDGAGGTATATVTVNVAAVNDAPIAGTDNVTAFKDNSLTIFPSTLLGNDSPGLPANEATQTLSIASVSSTSDTNGTVVLNSDGTITYTPNDGYTGPASFEYTLRDSGPGDAPNVNTATGTVNVVVQEFLPSSISGRVWVDETFYTKRDNAIDPAERFLAGVEVTLTGSTLGQAIAPQTMLTLADGSYSFDGLGPGNYTVSYAIPEFMLDNPDVPDQYVVDVVAPGGLTASDYNFAVIGIEAGYGRLLEQLASRSSANRHDGAYFAVGADNTLEWASLLDGYEGAQFAEAVFSANGSQLFMTIVDANQNVHTATLRRNVDFVSVRDGEGNNLVRVMTTGGGLNWQQVDLDNPPGVPAAKYLDAVDEIFAQEDWDN